MKFAKVLLIAAGLSPSVAFAQGTQQPIGPIIPTNFLPLVPVVVSFFAVPFVLGDDDNTVAVVVPPVTPPGKPVVTTR